MWHSCKTILTWHSCKTLLTWHSCKTLLMWHSYLTLLIWHSCKTILSWHSCRHLLCRHQFNCGDTDHSHRHLLCKHQYNCDDTDHSHRHLLCKHRYNCGATDHSLRHLLCRHQFNCGNTDHSLIHLLCKHQYNCGDTDHSHRHLLCKHQYNCGDTTQLDTVSGPLQTRSPLWRALRRHRKRLRTLANGCDRKRKTWRTQPHPQTPKWNGNPRYAFGKRNVTKYRHDTLNIHGHQSLVNKLEPEWCHWSWGMLAIYLAADLFPSSHTKLCHRLLLHLMI